MLASDSGHTEVVQLLLSSGAKVDLQNKVRHINVIPSSSNRSLCMSEGTFQFLVNRD